MSFTKSYIPEILNRAFMPNGSEPAPSSLNPLSSTAPKATLTIVIPSSCLPQRQRQSSHRPWPHHRPRGFPDSLMNRLRGKSTWYIPGIDHAGLRDLGVYERALEKKRHTRFEYSRDELYSRVWNFVEQQRGNMELQVRALGASCAWPDLIFTLTKTSSPASTKP